MQQEVLLGALAAVFGAMAFALLVLSPLVSWGLLFVAFPMGLVGYLLWYHASGRLTERMRQHAARDARRRAARTASTGPRGGRADPRGARGPAGGSRDSATDGPAAPETGMSRQRALAVLGLGRDADGTEVTAAYREKVKEVHPDRGGDEDAFKRVKTAYETLND